MKIEDQLVDILTQSLGRVKFAELSAKIGVNKVWDVKKINEENVGGDFPSLGMAGARGAPMGRREKATKLLNWCKSRRAL